MSPPHQFIFTNYSMQLNVAFINIAPTRARENYNHAIVGILGIAVTVLLSALQLKYQAGTDSAFQDHPRAMVFAIASFLVFCLVCDLEQYFRSTHNSAAFATVLHQILRLFGFISLASLAFVIFSPSTSSRTSLIVYLIFPGFFSARLVLHWIQNRKLRGNRGACNFHNSDPHFVDSDYLSYIDTLPVYHRAPANLV
uniref:Uncharacterized protein n=1 Tax=Daucus carota subsp. sativus TaxID=79200 RepID=A0A175YKI7_DAUCS